MGVWGSVEQPDASASATRSAAVSFRRHVARHRHADGRRPRRRLVVYREAIGCARCDAARHGRAGVPESDDRSCAWSAIRTRRRGRGARPGSSLAWLVPSVPTWLGRHRVVAAGSRFTGASDTSSPKRSTSTTRRGTGSRSTATAARGVVVRRRRAADATSARPRRRLGSAAPGDPGDEMRQAPGSASPPAGPLDS